MRKVVTCLAVIIFLAGLGVFLYPWITKVISDVEADRTIEKFRLIAEEEDEFSRLYEAMQEYNQEIYKNRQSGLSDQLSYQTPSFDLTKWGLEDNVVGYITIPKMEVELPIYLGANEENMKRGAVHLSQTSLPVGGNNTNCVIAAHRGYRGAPFFREIQLLEEGDEILITNLWETLVYEVESTKVIMPDESDKIMIQEGRELVTLTTCHPYTQNTYRYIVYAKRKSTNS